MITGITGLPGSGKTLLAVSTMLQLKGKRRCLANFHSRTGSWEFGLWPDMVEAGNCLAIIDEAQMWFSARSWNKQTQLELSWFQQSRKEGLDLIWIAQHEARVDTAIREVTAFYKKCRSLFHGRLVMVKTVTPDEPKKAVKIEFFAPTPSLFRHYWTEQRIGDREGTGYAFGRASVSGGPALWRSGDGQLIIAPNTWRIEFPYGKVRYLSEYLQVPGVVSLALASWSRAGASRGWRDIVSMGYRDSYGLLHAVDADNILQPTEDLEAPANWLLSALKEVEHTVASIPERVGLLNGVIRLENTDKQGNRI